MEYKITITDNYLLIVDDSEIKGKGFRLDLKRNSVGFIDDDIYYNERKDEFKKIISHLPINNSPILEGVDLLPPLEDDELDKIYDEVDYAYNDWKLFEKGYNKAKEKYKYTEDDIRKAYMKGKHGGVTETYYEIDDYIQSLQQPKMPIDFECKMITMNKGYTEESDYPYQQCDIPKTITNSQGQTEWVGKYIF